MSNPLGVDIFLFFLPSVVRNPASVTLCFQSFQGKVFILSLPNFGMGVYWVNSSHGIAFDEDSSIAN